PATPRPHALSLHDALPISAANTGLTLAYILLGRQPSAGEQVALGVGGSMVFAKFSRDDEREADSVAVGYLTEARIDPSGMVDMRSEEHTSELQSRENLVCR